MFNILSAIIGLFTCNGNKNKEDIDEMKLDIRMIKENHLHHIERDINDMKTDIKIILVKLSN